MVVRSSFACAALLPLLQRVSGEPGVQPLVEDVACDFLRKDGKKMSNEDLEVHYSEYAQPTILTSLMDGWLAREKWSLEQLTKDHGHIPVSSSEMTNGFRSMWDFTEDLYVRDVLNSSLIFFTNEELSAALAEDFGDIPDYLLRHEGLVGVSVGSRGAFAVHHSHKPGWFGQVKGRKLWIVTAPGVDSEWSKTYRDVCRMPEEAFVGVDVQRCVVHPGEVLYLPNQWGHSTCNLDEWSIGVGVIGHFHSAVTFAVENEDFKQMTHFMNMEHWKRPTVQGDAVATTAKYGHVTMMDFLLSKGSPKDGTEVRTVPINEAAAHGHAKMVKFLMKKGVDPFMKGRLSAMEAAAVNGRLEVVQTLYEHCKSCYMEVANETYSPIHLAASEGHMPILRYLTDLGENPRGPDRANEMLYAAARSGHVAAVDLLMAKHGAEPKNAVVKGESSHALHAAASAGHVRVVQRLIERSVNPEEPNQHGDQAIHQAAFNGVVDVVQQLLQARVDPEAKSGRGENVWSVASFKGHRPVMDLLMTGHDEL